MKLDILPIGLYEENIYILHEDGHVLIIDPGRFPDEISSHIQADEVVDGILLTHGHSDHTGAVDDLIDLYKCNAYIHKDDYCLVDPNFSRVAGAETPVYSHLSYFEEGQMKIGEFNLEIIHTPGHSLGSVLIKYRNILFTGDTIFASDIGRTDLYGGNDEDMINSLIKISKLDHDLIIYPGHGLKSTIGNELKVNPYFRYYKITE